MRHIFQAEQWAPHSVKTVFAFFANPENLPRLMPAWQEARIESIDLIAAPAQQLGNPGKTTAAGIGTRMTLSFRPFPLSPIRMKWEAAIVEFQWNDHFCDEQPKGPFAYWRHCHHVSREDRNGIEGTSIVDDLIYELPFGILSEPAHAIFVRRQIAAIFEYRQKRLLKLLEEHSD
jgi:ligand-binding SRPBCC domain-containing protein